jgi:predicted  nucleic acid-binding Zn-ribbon protein
MLHPELEILLEIQDLQTLHRDGTSTEVGAAELPVDTVEHARRTHHLQALIAQREARLSPSVANRYRRLAQRHERVVAPVINGVCSACFVHVPTSRGRDSNRHSEVRTCESCGRFLWYAE